MVKITCKCAAEQKLSKCQLREITCTTTVIFCRTVFARSVFTVAYHTGIALTKPTQDAWKFNSPGTSERLCMLHAWTCTHFYRTQDFSWLLMAAKVPSEKSNQTYANAMP